MLLEARGSAACLLRGFLRGLLRLGIGDAIDELFGQAQVGFGAAGVGIIKDGGFAMAGRFGESDVAWDRGLAHEVAEEAAQLGGNGLREVGAFVEHGEDDAFDGEGAIELDPDAVDRVEQLGDAFEGEVLGLHRDEDGVGCDQGVEREEVERGRTVENDEVEAIAHGLERLAEAILPGVEGDELDVGTEQILVRRDDGEVLEFGGLESLLGGEFAHQDLVGVGAVGVAQEAEAAGSVGLGVAVDQEGWGLVRGERRGEVDGGGRLADSALLVGDRDDSSHWLPRVLVALSGVWTELGGAPAQLRTWEAGAATAEAKQGTLFRGKAVQFRSLGAQDADLSADRWNGDCGRPGGRAL